MSCQCRANHYRVPWQYPAFYPYMPHYTMPAAYNFSYPVLSQNTAWFPMAGYYGFKNRFEECMSECLSLGNTLSHCWEECEGSLR